MNINQGYVYVMINPSYDGIVKIGKTTKEPEERAKELSSATGVATPFIVVYKRLFKNCHLAESIIHSYFTEKGFRVNNSREFFSVPIDAAINFIINVSDDDGNTELVEDQGTMDTEDLKDVYYSTALDYEIGNKNTFIDYEKAIYYYLKAGELGHIRAYDAVGHIYELDLNNNKKAIEFYKKSVENGWFVSYTRLGILYLSSEYKNEMNQYLAWDNFIEYCLKIDSNLEEFFLQDIVVGCYNLIYYYNLYRMEIPEKWIIGLRKYKNPLLEYATNKYNKYKIDLEEKYGYIEFCSYKENKEKYLDILYLDDLLKHCNFINNL